MDCVSETGIAQLTEFVRCNPNIVFDHLAVGSNSRRIKDGIAVSQFVEVAMTMERCVKVLAITAKCEQEELQKMVKCISENYFIQSCWIYHLNGGTERLEKVTNRNKYLMKQQRFKKTKSVETDT